MKKYIVKTTAIFHNGKRYGVGETIELSDADVVAVASYVVPSTQTKETENKAKAEPKPTPKTTKK